MNRELSTQIALTLGILFLLFAAHYQPLHKPVYANPAFQVIDSSAEAYLDDTFNKALVAFAAARATNAILSLLQDSELDLPLVTIAIGEVLDPLNDLVERFSWVMLVSLTSIGIQKFLLQISPWVGINLLLSLSLALFLAGIWGKTNIRAYTLPLAKRLLFVALLVRFCVPTIAWVNAQTYDLFLANDHQIAASQINQRTTQLKSFQQELTMSTDGANKSLWQRTKDAVAGTFSLEEWRLRFQRIEATVTAMISSFLKLIVVFLLQTILLPIFFLWGLVRLFKVFTGSNHFGRLEQQLAAKIGGNEVPASAVPVDSNPEPVATEENEGTEKS